MAIQYAGGTIRNDYYAPADCLDPATHVENIKTTLIAAGWTQDSLLAARCSIIMNTAGTDGHYVKIANVTYTFKDTLTASYQIKIGATAAETADNLKAAVNQESGEGTKYGTGTVLHPDVTAARWTTGACEKVEFVAKVAGTGGYTLGDSGKNAYSGATVSFIIGGFTIFPFYGGGYRLKSATDANGAFMYVEIGRFAPHDTGGNSVRQFFWAVKGPNLDGQGCEFIAQDVDTVLFGNLTQAPNSSVAPYCHNCRTPQALSTYGARIIANKYQFFHAPEGVTINGINSDGFLAAGQLFVRLADRAHNVTGATNASPIVITDVAHGKLSGDTVYIHSVGGNTAANGEWQITKISADTYSLNTSAGNGDYTSGGKASGIVSQSKQIGCAIWSFNSSENLYGSAGLPFFTRPYASCLGFLKVNSRELAGSLSTSSQGSSVFALVKHHHANTDYIESYPIKWYTEAYLAEEPVVCFNTVSGQDPTIIGQLYDAFIMSRGWPEYESQDADSHSWYNLTCETNYGEGGTAWGPYSFWVAIT